MLISIEPLTWVWCASIADNLSQQDTKGPDVWFDGEGAIVDGFRGRPFDGELCSWLKRKSKNIWSNVDDVTASVLNWWNWPASPSLVLGESLMTTSITTCERGRRPTFSGCVLVVFNDTGEAKVSNFAHQSLIDQDVGSPQVSVDVVPLLNESHALCNLKINQSI